ncbi:MAG: hypothetical protein KA163_00770 [Bacteroidia bacterium]|nr:hypothetical protein [Bacteroidia bacterium]
MDDFVPRDLWEYDQKVRVEWLDIFGSCSAAILILFIAMLYQNRKLVKDKAYKHYLNGLAAKICGTFFFCSIYLFYYKGGDTIAYFESSMAMANLFYLSPTKYFEVMTSTPSVEIRSLFTDKTGYPYSYLFYDSHTFMVIKLTSIMTIITSKSYFLTSLLISSISYFGIWKLFLTFRQYAPAIEGKLAWAILYFPSPLFWAGGVSKDTYTYMGTALFVYCAHQFFILKKRKVVIIALLLVSSWLILSIKPYIFMVLFPGGLLWIFYDKLERIRNPFVSFILFPLMIAVISFLSYFVLSNLGSSMDRFSFDKALETAAVTNNDLKQDYYGGSSFDIGSFDGSLTDAAKLFLPAVNAGLFRPYLIEGRSPVLFLAGLENTFLLLFTIYVLYKIKPKNFFRIISKNPILLFCVIYSVLFAFMIGLTTSNYGALVRFKIPLLPFFVSTLFIIEYLYKIKSRPSEN